MWLPLFSAVLSISVVVSMVIFYGVSIIQLLYTDKKNRVMPLFLGLSYFAGIALLLSLWRLTSFVLGNAIFSFYITNIFLMIISIVLFKKERSTELIQEVINTINKYKWIILIIFILVASIVALKWMGSFSIADVYTSAYHDIGTINSGRHVNIITYIVESNRIPILGQSFGQSILSSIPLFFGIKTPFLNLTIWLIFSISFLIFLSYGVLRYFKLNIFSAILGVFVLMVGNTALTLGHILVLDSMNPLAFNGYTDSIFAIGSFFFFLFWIKSCFSEKNISLFVNVLAALSIGISWNLCGAQNIVLVIPLFLIILFFAFIRKFKYMTKITIVSILFFIAVSIGIFQGGMLTLDNKQDRLQLEGVHKVVSTLSKIVSFNPAFVHHTGFGRKWERNYHRVDISKVKNVDSFFYEFIVGFEKNLWEALRLTFWPVLGFILMFLLLFTKSYEKLKILDNKKIIQEKFLLLFSSGVFIIGFSINFFIAITNHKWELSRFLMSGNFLGVLCLILALSKIFNNTTSKKAMKIIIFFIVGIMTIGPIMSLSLSVSPRYLIQGKTLNVITRVSGYVGRNVEVTSKLLNKYSNVHKKKVEDFILTTQDQIVLHTGFTGNFKDNFIVVEDKLKLENNFNIQIIVKPGSKQVPYADILSNHFDHKGIAIEGNGKNNSNYLFYQGMGGGWIISPSFELMSNVWNYLTITVQDKMMTIYHNGEKIAVSKSDRFVQNSDKMLYIGASGATNNRDFNGEILEILIINGVLDEKQINKNWEIIKKTLKLK
ncbi:LamG-like jellyroll fold domain-containing protein [bacterium]